MPPVKELHERMTILENETVGLRNWITRFISSQQTDHPLPDSLLDHPGVMQKPAPEEDAADEDHSFVEHPTGETQKQSA